MRVGGGEGCRKVRVGGGGEGVDPTLSLRVI